MRLSALITLRNKADLIKVAAANAPVGAQFDLVDDPENHAKQRPPACGGCSPTSPTS